eukprot:2816355-Pleurochrysis_carterae.AAC.2
MPNRGHQDKARLMIRQARAEQEMQKAQINDLRVPWGMVWACMAISATKWPCAPPAKRRRLQQHAGRAAIPGDCMAKLFGSAAYAILNELTYYCHHNLRNQ